MKILYVLILLLPISFVTSNAQDPIDKTAELLKTANASELARDFAPTVEISIGDNDDSYPANKAEAVLQNFFNKNQPRSVKIFHRITSNPNYRFAVLILDTSNGNYRVSINLKNTSGRFLLNEVRIEPEK